MPTSPASLALIERFNLATSRLADNLTSNACLQTLADAKTPEEVLMILTPLRDALCAIGENFENIIPSGIVENATIAPPTGGDNPCVSPSRSPSPPSSPT